MRSLGVAALFLFGTTTTACLRSGSTGLDASSNGNSNGDGTSDASNNGGSNGNPRPDAGSTTHHDGGTMGVPDAAMSGPPCKNKTTPPGNGHHNAGTDCMNSCHNHGFTLAGTLYSSATGGSALSGASITVKDASGQTFDIVSQTDGNFYTTQSVQFPLTVYASECDLSQTGTPMMATVTSAQRGGCNATGCHTTNAQGHIHIP